MAFELSTLDTVPRGLKRIVRRELEAAITRLDHTQPSDEQIHEARTSIKKVRAVLTLLGHRLGATRMRKPLRQAGHFLGPIRDAQALVESARDLCASHTGKDAVPFCAPLRSRLERDKKQDEATAVKERSVEQAAKCLRRVRRAVSTWEWNRVSRSVLLTAIRKSYRQARRGLRSAATTQQADAFHDWRKRVKTLGYALRLVEPLAPGAKRQRQRLHDLQSWLGDDHNLELLRARVSAIPALAGASAAAAARQGSLRAKALVAGRSCFRSPARVFVRSLTP